jgi:hypothetical protein
MGAVCRRALKLTAKVRWRSGSLLSARSPIKLQFIQVEHADARP